MTDPKWLAQARRVLEGLSHCASDDEQEDYIAEALEKAHAAGKAERAAGREEGLEEAAKVVERQGKRAAGIASLIRALSIPEGK